MNNFLGKVDEVEKTFNSLKWGIENSSTFAVKSEKEKFEFLTIFKNFIYRSIHEDLRNEEHGIVNEKELLIRKLVKYTIRNLLPIVKKKTEEYSIRLSSGAKITDEKELENINNWLDLEDDLYAIASFRSLTNLALYLERDDMEDQLVWHYIMKDVMGGIFYYANAMILNGKYTNLFKQCPTGFGKCFQLLNNVLTSSGYKYAKDIQVGDYVYSLDNNTPTLNKVTNKWYTKKKQYKIKARNGAEITISPEHRMYTQRGYVQAKDLTTDDYFYEICSPLKYGIDLNEDEMKFITMMVFDGCCTKNDLSFIKGKNEIFNEFTKTCDKFGFSYRVKKLENKNCSVVYLHSNKGKVKELLEKYNLFGCYSKNKRLPKQFFNMSLKQRYIFIGILLATDGFIPKPSLKGGNNIGISLSNYELCKDIQLILSTCGIYSCLTKRKTKCNNKEFSAYTLTIPDEFLDIIYKNCYCYQKQKSLEERYNYYNNLEIKPYCNAVNYPKEVLENCKEFKKINNKQWKRNKTFKRETVNKYSKQFDELRDIASDHFVWNKIIDINYIDEETDMVDIEVENTHNFIANGFVSHNSKSDCVIICYILGYNPSASVFKVVGNPTLVGEITENVVKMLKSKRFGKVFPEFGKCAGNNRKMFKVLKKSDGEFLLNGSKKARSFFCVNKDTSIDGVRYDYQFYDDVTQSKDRENVIQHKKDIGSYRTQWEKRKSTDFKARRFFTGTAYHREDFLSYVKRFYANGRPLIKDISTMIYSWSKFVKLSEDKQSVYIIVPKLMDLELGIDKCYCTFPQKYSKESALKMLEGGPDAKREFYAMEQQTPLPPESLIFDWAYLLQYNKLPQDILENKSDDCRAVIDPSRGSDFFCCIIFKKSAIEHTDKWFLVDCFYRRCSAKVALPEIAQKLKKHKVNIIYLENNLDYEELLSLKINEIDYFDYRIETFYTTENKNDKIGRQQDDMKDLIIYPQQNMYHYTSEMGQGLSELTSYSLEKKIPHDDFTDCCAIFTIQVQENIQNSLEVLDFRIF